MNKLERLFSITVLTVLLSLSVYSLAIKEQDTLSTQEKRTLSTNADLKDLSLLDSKFHATVESILADQFFERYRFVKEKSELNYSFTQTIYQFVDNPFILKRIGDTAVYQIGNTPYLTAYPLVKNMDYEKRILDRIDQINQLANDYPDVHVYVYKPTQLIETSLLDQSNSMESAGEYYTSLFSLNLKVPFASLEINSFDDYLRYLYYSDHHWTHQGIYQGYLDIVKLMFGNDDNVLVPWGENCFDDLRFYGTTSVITGKITEPAPFCVYGYTMPPYTLWYENQIRDVHYDSNNFYFVGPSGREGYHYDEAYNLIQEPLTLIELDTPALNQENILIIGDSYAPAVLPLLANHFNQIFYVNPLTYESVYDEKFAYDSFIKDHSIKNVLFMYIIDNYIVSDEWGERYKSFDIVRD